MHPLNTYHMLDVFPQITTPRLTLGALLREHASGLFNLFTNADVIRYYPVLPFANAHDCEALIDKFGQRYKNKEEIRWGLFRAGQPELIGIIALQNLTHSGKATLVFALHPDFWRQGIASEAIAAVTDWGFKQLKLTCIDAEVMPANNVSERILLKAGFVFTGFYADKLEWNNKKYDINSYLLTRNC